jgi:hypothetical protein
MRNGGGGNNTAAAGAHGSPVFVGEGTVVWKLRTPGNSEFDTASDSFCNAHVPRRGRRANERTNEGKGRGRSGEEFRVRMDGMGRRHLQRRRLYLKNNN